MSIVLKLFKLQIDEIYNLFKGDNIKKLIGSIIKYILIILLISVGLYIVLGQILMLGFEINIQLLSITLLATQIISLIFATGNIISTLYLNKNNEILLTLPASSNHIFLSKTLVIYVQEVIVNSIYTLPVLIIFGMAADYSIYFYLIMPLFLLLLPLLPLSIAALISIPVTKALKFLKKHVLVSTIAILSVVTLLLLFYVRVLTSIATFDIANDQLNTVNRINTSIERMGDNNFLFLRLAKSIIRPLESYWLFVYLLLGGVFFVGASLLIRPFFFKTAMQTHEDAAVGKAQERRFKKNSVFFSLVKKEFLMVFRHPGYVFQYFIFALLMPIIVILYDKLLFSLDIVNKTGQTMIAGAHVLIVVMLALLSNIISASAISREGGNFYIMKTSPVDYYKQTGAKLVFNASFTIAAILLTGILTLIAKTPVSAGTVIFTTFAAIFISIGHICLSFDLDLKKPTLNWHDSGDITKISSNTTKSILWAIGLSILSGVIIILLAAYSVLPWLILIGAAIFFCLQRVYLLILRVSYQYERLEM